MAQSTATGADAAVTYDVAVLGSHLASGLLAAILARGGTRVLLVDAPGDADLPSGESTVPYTTAVVQLLAERYKVPEAGAFAHFTDLPPQVRAASGIKKSLAFLHHTPGRRHEPKHTVQFHVPGEHNEWHLYRPVVDGYARDIAVSCGAEVIAGRPMLVDAAVIADGVVVTVADGQRFRAAYAVDASGPSSPLIDAVPDAYTVGGQRLTSRAMTAHMRRVVPFEDCCDLGAYKSATAFSKGTVHHLFDGGWIQITDFANHDETTSELVSVTVGLDPDRFADLPRDPDQAFAELISRFPSVAAQFAHSVVVRPWQDREPVQRRLTRAHGRRWIAIERTAAQTDEFLSRDVTMAAEIVNATASALIRVIHGDADAGAEFARVAAFQDALIDFNDSMLSAARVATRDFALWNAFTRVWLLWQILAHLSLKRATHDAATDPDGSWAAVERLELGGLWFDTPRGLAELLEWFFDLMERVRAGSVAAPVAADQIFRRLRKERFVPPLYRFGDPGSRYYHFTFGRRLIMAAWVKWFAPNDFRRLLTRDNVTGRRSDAPAAAVRTSASTSAPAASQPVGGRQGGSEADGA